MKLVKVKFKGGWALADPARIGQSREDVGLDGVWELYTEPAAESPKETPNLMDMTKAELIKIAEDAGLEVTDRMNKKQIADLIEGD